MGEERHCTALRSPHQRTLASARRDAKHLLGVMGCRFNTSVISHAGGPSVLHLEPHKHGSLLKPSTWSLRVNTATAQAANYDFIQSTRRQKPRGEGQTARKMDTPPCPDRFLTYS
ncbi:unnamed protein product [Pleuronectes platessa]|uniref:Uncharacterized protein n=1 Tax=Pleuronectes platessa TaxID=8262 RepID=A0A9N7ZBV8_PLEPL|nr:unnamed protein product [Pleuronectes platessa]